MLGENEDIWFGFFYLFLYGVQQETLEYISLIPECNVLKSIRGSLWKIFPIVYNLRLHHAQQIQYNEWVTKYNELERLAKLFVLCVWQAGFVLVSCYGP